jgi:hypothetical protein
MLPDYQTMSTAILVDLLAQETQKLTQIMSGKELTPEYEESKQTILQIQATIQSKENPTISTPDISFGQPDTTA